MLDTPYFIIENNCSVDSLYEEGEHFVKVFLDKALKMYEDLKKYFEMRKYLSEEHLKEVLKKKFFF